MRCTDGSPGLEDQLLLVDLEEPETRRRALRLVDWIKEDETVVTSGLYGRIIAIYLGESLIVEHGGRRLEVFAMRRINKVGG